MLAFVTISGAPLTRFCVYTAAAAARFWETISARSRLSRFLRMPQWMPLAVKPLRGADAAFDEFHGFQTSCNTSPAVISASIFRLRSCTAAPDAPLPRLS